MRYYYLLLAWLLAGPALGQLPGAAQVAAQERAATCTLEFLQARRWVSESQGYNAGPGVEELVKRGGGDYRQKPEWCGFTQAATNRSCGLPIPKHGMQGAARAWFPLTGPDAGRTEFRRGVLGSMDNIRPGLKAGFDYGRGIHHVAEVVGTGRAIRAGRPPRTVYTLAGNEGKGTKAGLHLTEYPATSIDALSNWLY